MTSPAAAAAPEEIPEDVSNDIPEIHTAEIEASRTGGTVKCSMAKLVILAPLIRITENGIGFRSLLEFFLRLPVARIHVGMIFLCQSPICLFDRSIICILLNTKNLIIVPLLLSHRYTSFST